MKRIFLIFSIFLAATFSINCALAAKSPAQSVDKKVVKITCLRDNTNRLGWRANDLLGNRLHSKKNLYDYVCKSKATTQGINSETHKFTVNYTYPPGCRDLCTPGDANCVGDCYCKTHSDDWGVGTCTKYP